MVERISDAQLAVLIDGSSERLSPELLAYLELQELRAAKDADYEAQLARIFACGADFAATSVEESGAYDAEANAIIATLLTARAAEAAELERVRQRCERQEEALRVISQQAQLEDGESAGQRGLIVDGCREVAANALKESPHV